MFLKSLEIHGFKSFADRTKLEFHPGVTGVVGPNGCGKSNIVDAVRWVLGETSAKALRGGEMADVIFNGTEKRQPVGMAEVSLTLSGCEEVLNVDFNEVSIGRRVYRDGKSEYLLNKKACRLKDIQDLLMDTGIGRSSYSIMEQGKIDQLLSSRPEDRRAVFEEAAGITKFKQQKKEALRKLDYTEANLFRLADIIAEVKRQMNSLQRQAAKARRYQEVHNSLRVLDLHLSHRNFRQLRAERAELETSIRSLRETQTTLEADIESLQDSVTGARDEYQRVENRIAETQAAIVEQENTARGATNRIEFNAERAHELSVLIQQNETDIRATTDKLSQQKEDLERAELMLQAIDQKIASQQDQLSQHENQYRASQEERQSLARHLTATREEQTRTEARIASLQARIDGATRQLDSDQQRFMQLDEELHRLQKEESQKSSETDNLQDQVTEISRKIAEYEEELSGAESAYQAARKALAEAESRLAELHRTQSQKTSRLDVLKQMVAQGEGFEKGTQKVLKGLNQPDLYLSAVRGALASFMQTDPQYISAIEAALGHHLQTIVVTDSLVAENIIETLKRGDFGQASLIAEDLVDSSGDQRQLMAIPDGGIGWAADKVEAPGKAQSLVNRLLADVLIVTDLSAALRLRKELPGTAFATLDGEFVSLEGIIHGGSKSGKGGSVLQRQAEISELEKVTAQLAEELAATEKDKQSRAAQLEELENRVTSARDKLQNKRVSGSTLDGQLSLVRRELQQIENKIESLRWEQKEVAQRQDELDDELKTAREDKEKGATNIGELANKTRELQDQLDRAERREHESASRLNEVRTAIAVERQARQSAELQRAPMASRMQELRDLLERRKNEIATYQERIQNSESEDGDLMKIIEEAKAKAVELRESLESVKQERDQCSAGIREGEQALSQKRRQVHDISEQRNKEEIRSTQMEIRLENLETSVRERYHTDLDRFEPDSHALLAAIEEQRKSHNRSPKVRAAVEARLADSPDGEDESFIPEDASEEAPDTGLAGDESEAEFDAEAETEAEIDLEDAAEPDWEFVEAVVAELRSRADSMGAVNLDAIVEFEELEERHTFLDSQHEDLVNSREALLKVIAKINRDSRILFAETFETVRQNFRDMFQELFGSGARADLILLDESDPLECGIDIIAKPPGKKLQSISLLSGGERSMTAVALLFAIYKVKPAPFCVLDELDAPLDEANINRFIRVLDNFINESQFIIVTHSKRTMSRADVIYGVSMEEFGVSKTVGMKFTSSETKSEAAKSEAAASAP